VWWLVGLILIFISLYLLYRVVTYQALVEVNSWGDPEPGEALGWCCIISIATLAVITLLVLGLIVLVSGLTG